MYRGSVGQERPSGVLILSFYCPLLPHCTAVFGMNGVYIEMGRIRKYHFLLFFSVSLIDARLLSGFTARSRGKLRTNMRLSGSSLLIKTIRPAEWGPQTC